VGKSLAPGKEPERLEGGLSGIATGTPALTLRQGDSPGDCRWTLVVIMAGLRRDFLIPATGQLPLEPEGETQYVIQREQEFGET